ncbi:hypothetical protein PV328_008818 [Microctonus aethiopoides]|uniref:C2H2-type domain-containing protein n=1 Tax=Microctonus aethiopoides TaxID=144406 RepID=A0AA39KRC5_9HYME|nr:hypothetical protein PV328_008818 [Microctonus aethiopoides]
METNFEDDDDTHYCIKCHMTVNGLDNYVRHRQTGCRPSERKNAVTPDPPTPTVSYPEILNADAFFSSLELQSSAKSKSTGARSGHEEEKKLERRGDKRRKTRRYNEIDVPSPKEKLMTLPPVVTDLDDPTDHIGIPSLVGFPDIVTFTDKASTSTKIQSSGVSKPNDSDKKRGNDEDQVWSDDDSEDIDENKITNVEDELESEEDFDYPQDEDTNDSQVDDIDQVDSYSETDEADDREYPPQAHTGGKWKPGQLLQHMIRQNDDDIDHDDDQDNSRPAHTGGKWKPEKINEDELEDDGKDEEIKDTALITRSSSSTRQPPPGHTHGKWIPGAMTMPSEHGYWCSPCGRKLASKLVYNRHLRSDLHARRSIQEIEGDVKLPRSVGPLLRKKCRSRRQQILAMKRSETKSTIVDNNATKKRRCREKEFVRCEMCHARVRRIQLGKHLLSHYHCRVAGLNPCSPAARRFILENMGNVVRQCPFQCSCCRFYCNTEETFLLHWRSNLHSQIQNDNESKYICVCCDFWCDDNATMEEHLLSGEHRETVAMINGSVPIVIRRQRFLICHTCNRRFRYNFQLRLHAKDTGHPINFTASDEYQTKIHCNLCPQILKSQLALQRHQLTTHNKSKEFKEKIPMPYFCSFCSINFETARDAVLHRRTASHKQIVKNRKFSSIEGETVPPLQRDCGHCGEKQNNLLEYRRHLLQCHSDQCHKCLKCKKIFALSQDIARHLKTDNCIKKLPRTDQKSPCNSDKSKCTKCSFFTKSQAEFIFHQAIHEGPIEIDPKQASSSTSDTPPAYFTAACILHLKTASGILRELQIGN